MEDLVLDQPYREAERIAADYFRTLPTRIGPEGEAFPAGPHGAPSSPAAPTEVVQYVRLAPDVNDRSSIGAAATRDPFLLKAVKTFALRPRQTVSFEIRSGDDGRMLEYAHAVRVTRDCLTCHDEGKSRTPFRENQMAGLIHVRLPLARSDGQLAFNRWVIIAAGALAGTLAILVFYVITHRVILSPIQRLRDVTIRVADGDLATRADVRTGDEFEQLSDHLNAMLEKLRESQDNLQKANVSLDQQLGQMAAANVALHEANRVKSEFLASVSHELRTPLTSIIGFAEILREGGDAKTNGKVSRYAENILISGRILLEIINDLLDLAKIEAGRLELRLEPANLQEVCTSLVDFMRPVADKKSVTLSYDGDLDLELQTDAARLRQVLYNLLSNAIKFSPHGGVVRVSARRTSEGARVAVTDEGPGIAPEHHGLIFEKFRQIDQSATREHQGTGLGLAIARELTELLGGKIGVESQIGHGATFWVDLPAPQPARERAHAGSNP